MATSYTEIAAIPTQKPTNTKNCHHHQRRYRHMDTEAVIEQIEEIHAEYASVVQYNNENSLSSVLSIAYWYSVVRIIKGVWCIRSENLCAGLFCFEKNFRIIDLNQVPDKTENERCSIIYYDNKSGTIFRIRKWNTELRKSDYYKKERAVSYTHLTLPTTYTV